MALYAPHQQLNLFAAPQGQENFSENPFYFPACGTSMSFQEQMMLGDPSAPLLQHVHTTAGVLVMNRCKACILNHPDIPHWDGCPHWQVVMKKFVALQQMQAQANLATLPQGEPQNLAALQHGSNSTPLQPNQGQNLPALHLPLAQEGCLCHSCTEFHCHCHVCVGKNKKSDTCVCHICCPTESKFGKLQHCKCADCVKKLKAPKENKCTCACARCLHTSNHCQSPTCAKKRTTTQSTTGAKKYMRFLSEDEEKAMVEKWKRGDVVARGRTGSAPAQQQQQQPVQDLPAPVVAQQPVQAVPAPVVAPQLPPVHFSPAAALASGQYLNPMTGVLLEKMASWNIASPPDSPPNESEQEELPQVDGHPSQEASSHSDEEEDDGIVPFSDEEWEAMNEDDNASIAPEDTPRLTPDHEDSPMSDEEDEVQEHPATQPVQPQPEIQQPSLSILDSYDDDLKYLWGEIMAMAQDFSYL